MDTVTALGLMSGTSMDENPSSIKPISPAIQVETSASPDTGAEVESTRYASFSREIRNLSIKGLIVFPSRSELA